MNVWFRSSTWQFDSRIYTFDDKMGGNMLKDSVFTELVGPLHVLSKTLG